MRRIFSSGNTIQAAQMHVTEHSPEAKNEMVDGSWMTPNVAGDEDGNSESLSPLFFAHPIELIFYNLNAKNEAHIRLAVGGKARWGNGDPSSQLVGVSLSAAPRGSSLALSSFRINHVNVSIITNAPCQELHAKLYVHTLERSFSGRVDIPSGSILTIESPYDRTTLAESGLGSYTLMLR